MVGDVAVPEEGLESGNTGRNVPNLTFLLMMTKQIQRAGYSTMIRVEILSKNTPSGLEFVSITLDGEDGRREQKLAFAEFRL